jgi:NitT/TauT family transport system permease protein
LKKALKVVISLSVLIGIWQLAVMSGKYQPSLLPSPAKVLSGMWELIKDGSLLNHFKVSLIRFFIGYLASIAAGITLGLILGRNKRVWSFIEPVVQVLRPVSPIAWFPFIVLWFGIGDAPAIVIIFIAGFYPILLSTVSGVGNVDGIYLKVADNFGIRQPQMLFKIIFPAAFPLIVNGLHLALGSAWVFLVAGEMVGAQSGLGYLIIDARNSLRSDLVLAGIIFIGALGLLLDRLIRLLETAIEKQWGISQRRN